MVIKVTLCPVLFHLNLPLALHDTLIDWPENCGFLNAFPLPLHTKYADEHHLTLDQKLFHAQAVDKLK